MEGDCLSCMKYLMFLFNFFIFLGGACLLGLGIWVIVDPTGFREIVAANPLLFTGAYIMLAMGAMLFLLGFLGCCGAIRENKCLLLFFFMFILLIFLAELSAAILAFIFRENVSSEKIALVLVLLYIVVVAHLAWKLLAVNAAITFGLGPQHGQPAGIITNSNIKVCASGTDDHQKNVLLSAGLDAAWIKHVEKGKENTEDIFQYLLTHLPSVHQIPEGKMPCPLLTREFFTKELKKHYQRNNDTDVFSSTWNSVMITFACCGVNGPEDFEAIPHLPYSPLEKATPEACCQRELQSREGMFVNKEACLSGIERFQNRQGCYTVILNSFETYVYLAGALAIGVLAIELFAMIFAMCLFRGIQ